MIIVQDILEELGVTRAYKGYATRSMPWNWYSKMKIGWKP